MVNNILKCGRILGGSVELWVGIYLEWLSLLG